MSWLKEAVKVGLAAVVVVDVVVVVVLVVEVVVVLMVKIEVGVEMEQDYYHDGERRIRGGRVAIFAVETATVAIVEIVLLARVTDVEVVENTSAVVVGLVFLILLSWQL